MKRAWIWVLLLMLVLAVVYYLVAYSDREQAPDEIRIGLVSELTGEAAAWGTDLKEGIDLAIENVNAAGGVSGKLLRPSAEDDEGSPRIAANATLKLITQDRIQAMLGVAVSTVAQAMIPILEQNRVMFISGGASSPTLTGASPYFFRTWPSDLEEALVAAKYVRETAAAERVVVAHANDDYGVGLARPFQSEFENLGGSVADVISFEKGAGDYKPQVVKISQAEADVVFLAGAPRDMALVLKQLREGGVELPVFSVSGIKEREVIEIAGAAAEGVRFVDASFDPTSDRPETQEFIQSFEVKYGKGPGVLAASGYDSVLVLTAAIERAGSLDPDELRTALLALEGFPGVVGDITFTADGNVHRPVRISAIQDGDFVLHTDE